MAEATYAVSQGGSSPLPDSTVTRASIARRRRLAEALAEYGKYGAAGWAGVASDAFRGLLAGYQEGKANTEEKDITSRLANALKNGGTDAYVNEAMNTGDLNAQGYLGYAEHQADNKRADARAAQQDRQWQASFDLQKEVANRKAQKFVPASPEDQAKGIAGYDGDTGNPIFVPKPQFQITNQNGGGDTGDLEYDKKIAAQDAELHKAYRAQADTSSDVVRKLDAAQELFKMAPSGPVMGTLAQYFPQGTTAGAAANSIVRGLAPSMRAQGSGSTSDRDFDSILQSLPRMANYEGANALIVQAFHDKQQIDQARVDIINQIGNGLTRREANAKLAELNRKSIMSPALAGLIKAAGGKDQSQAGGLTPVAPTTQTNVMVPGQSGLQPAPAGQPLQEGQTGMSKSGRPIIVRGGQWTYAQ